MVSVFFRNITFIVLICTLSCHFSPDLLAKHSHLLSENFLSPKSQISWNYENHVDVKKNKFGDLKKMIFNFILKKPQMAYYFVSGVGVIVATFAALLFKPYHLIAGVLIIIVYSRFFTRPILRYMYKQKAVSALQLKRKEINSFQDVIEAEIHLIHLMLSNPSTDIEELLAQLNELYLKLSNIYDFHQKMSVAIEAQKPYESLRWFSKYFDEMELTRDKIRHLESGSDVHLLGSDEGIANLKIMAKSLISLRKMTDDIDAGGNNLVSTVDDITPLMKNLIRSKNKKIDADVNTLDPVIDRIAFEVENITGKILQLEEHVLPPNSPQRILLHEASEGEVKIMEMHIEEDFDGTAKLLYKENNPCLWKYFRHVGVSQPFFAIILDQNNVPHRVFIKDSEFNNHSIHTSHYEGNMLIHFLGFKSGEVFAGEKYEYISEIEGTDIKEFLNNEFDDLSEEEKTKFFYSLGFAMSCAHVAGIEDRFQNVMVNSENLKNFSMEELRNKNFQAVVHIDKESAISEKNLKMNAHDDIFEIYNMLYAAADHARIFQSVYKNSMIYVKGVEDGFEYIRKYSNHISDQMINILAKDMGENILKRVNMSDLERSKVIENIKVKILDKLEVWEKRMSFNKKDILSLAA